MVTGTTNFGMDDTAAAKTEALALCADAVNYVGNFCIDGISGTTSTKTPHFEHHALRDGTVVWADKSGKKMIQFTFTEESA